MSERTHGQARGRTAQPGTRPRRYGAGHGASGSHLSRRSRPPNAERHCDHSPCVTVVTSRPASPGSRPLAALPPPITSDRAGPGGLGGAGEAVADGCRVTCGLTRGTATAGGRGPPIPQGRAGGQRKRKTKPYSTIAPAPEMDVSYKCEVITETALRPSQPLPAARRPPSSGSAASAAGACGHLQTQTDAG